MSVFLNRNKQQITKMNSNEYQKIRDLKSPLPTSRTFDGNDLIEKQAIEKNKKKKKSLTFPWWFKIIAYALSFIFMAVSSAVVIFQGIEFGDEKCGKWLSSLVISFFTSVLLTQPLKV